MTFGCFVCNVVRRPFNAQVILETLSNFLGRIPKRFINVLMHILSPVTENCPSGFRGRKRVGVFFVTKSPR